MNKEYDMEGIKLVQMLFDALLEALDKAEDAIEKQKPIVKKRSITRALKIIFGLQMALNTEGKDFDSQWMAYHELVLDLDKIYTYCIKRIRHASTNNDVKALEEVRALISTISSAWALLPMTKEVA